MKSCTTCKHIKLKINEVPCDTCEGVPLKYMSNWEPRK